MITDKTIAKHLKEVGLIRTETKAREVIEEVKSFIIKSLDEGREVRLNNLGKFEMANRKPRTARNVKTGEEIRIPAKQSVKFRPYKGLKDLTKEI